MTEELREKLNIIKRRFESFSNFIELADFRSYLLFTLNSQVSSNILAQFGLGGNKEVINIPYNPLFSIYYQKINLISAGALIVYVKNEPITDKFILKKDSPLFKEYLNPISGYSTSSFKVTSFSLSIYEKYFLSFILLYSSNERSYKSPINTSKYSVPEIL